VQKALEVNDPKKKEENQITDHTWNDPSSTGRTIDSKKDTETMNESEKRERFSRLLPLCQTITIPGAASNMIISRIYWLIPSLYVLLF
jgi:hypothetical protein